MGASFENAGLNDWRCFYRKACEQKRPGDGGSMIG